MAVTRVSDAWRLRALCQSGSHFRRLAETNFVFPKFPGTFYFDLR
jgi:hypothetical protein